MSFAHHKKRLAPGTIISDRFQIVCCIGSGGMGTVYEVRHRRLDRSYAAKVLAHDLANDYTALARFRREAEIISGLRHPNIVDIVDWDNLDDGTPCIVMEYLQGESLSTRLQRLGALPWSDIVSIGQQVLSALAMAHGEGIVHRDLKPDNIFLAKNDAGQEVAKLLDFGVSKIRNTNTLATQDTSLLGTPAYMSPEQAESRASEIDETTDLWAMGAILYEMACNQTAFNAASVPSLLYKVCHSDPIPLAQLRLDVPPAFQQLVSRALCRDRRGRFANAQDMSAALAHALSPESMAAAAMAATGPIAGKGERPPTLDPTLDPTMARSSGPITGMSGPLSLGHHPHHQTTFSQASGEAQNLPPRRRRVGLTALLAIALIGVGLAVGFAVSRTGDSSQSPTRSATPGADEPAVPTPPPVAEKRSATDEPDAGPGAVEPPNDTGTDGSHASGSNAATAASKPDKTARSKKVRKKVRPRDKTRKRDKTDATSQQTNGQKTDDRKKGEPVNPFGEP